MCRPLFQILTVWLEKKRIPAAMFPTTKQETKTFLCDQVILNVTQLVLSHRGHGNNNAAL